MYKRSYAVTSPVACSDESNTVVITVSPLADAGIDQSDICFEDASFTLAAVGSGSWTWAAGSPTASISSATDGNATIDGFTAGGVYTLVWTTDDGCTDEVVLTVGTDCNCTIDNNDITGPAVLEYCGEATNITLVGSDATPAGGTYEWLYSSDNGASFSPVGSDRDLTLASLSVGTHMYQRVYSVTSPIACDDESNTVIITVYPAANAGLDQDSECFETAMVTMAASGTGTWTMLSGMPTVNIVDATDPATDVDGFPQMGIYTLVWTTDDGCTDQVNITVGDDCNCSISNNTITQPTPDSYCGQSDDITILGSDATPAGGTYSWEYFDGNAYVAATGIADNRDYNTGILTAGVHMFRRTYVITAPVGCSRTTTAVTITVTAEPDAGSDIDATCIDMASDMVQLLGSGNGAWSQVSGPIVNIVSPATPTTAIQGFTTEGVYTFRYGTTSCFDDVDVTVSASTSAGSDQSVNCYKLDDATVTAEGAGTWSVQSGTATIADPSTATTTVDGFTQAGTVVLLWTAANGCTDVVNITVGDDCPCTIDNNNIAEPTPTTYCGMSDDISIVGTDATPAEGTYTWMYSTDGINYSPATGVNTSKDLSTGVLTVGEHYFMRVFTTDECSDESEVVAITVAEEVTAGTDVTLQCVRLPGGTITMAATGVGVWSSSDNIDIADVNDANTTVSGFAAAGTYSLVWSNGICDDEVQIIIEGQEVEVGPAATVACYATEEAMITATGVGTWSLSPDNIGEAVILDSNSATTTVTAFSQPGTYLVVYSDNTCSDTLAITVGDDCPCDIAGNNIIDDLNDLYCEAEGPVTLVGSDASPAGGSYLWQYSNDGILYVAAPGLNNEVNYTYSEVANQHNYFRRIYTTGDVPVCSDTSAVVSYKLFSTSFTPGDIELEPSTVCRGDTVTLTVSQYDGNFTYAWDVIRGRTLMQQDSMIMIVADVAGAMTVSVTQMAESCGVNMISDRATAEIFVNELPTVALGRDTTVCEFETVFELYAGEWPGGVTWQDGSEDDYFEVEEKGLYQATAIDSMGCAGTGSIRITSDCCDFAFPNIINVASQSGNNAFSITDIYNCSIESQYQIFDRWGNMVHSTNDGQSAWDGRFNGEFVEQGVYVFIYNYTAIDGNDQMYDGEVSGDITVLKR